MNYMLEIKLFYDWLETHELSSMGITLWHALMQVASRSGWQDELQISLSTLIGRTSLSRTSIYKERGILKKCGLIDYRCLGGRHAGIYVMRSFESRVVFAARTQTRTQTNENGEFESSVVSAVRTRVGIQMGNIYKLNYTNDGKERKDVAGLPAPVSTNSPSAKRKKVAQKKEKRVSPHFDADKWLENLEACWGSMMRIWLEYKRSRRERYKSEESVRKCLIMLHRLADDDLQRAAAIIDQSIANNWAGLFPLRTKSVSSSFRGQHPGQIIQPSSDERTRSLLEKFGRK